MKERDTSLKDSVPCQSGNTEDTEKEQTKNTINNEVSEKETNVTKILNKKRKITKQKSEQTLLQESDESTKEECTKDTNNFRKQESKCDASNSVGNTDKTENNEKDRKARKCRRKLMKSGLRSRKNEEKSPVSKLIHGRLPDHLQKRSNSTEDETYLLTCKQF
ncbi:hypothetical protein JTB14_002800 [Gonioctena quinquepunctata]|nr:hypothetical protein JTB14_002800 [Gonioctena quinquepunctata]